MLGHKPGRWHHFRSHNLGITTVTTLSLLLTATFSQKFRLSLRQHAGACSRNFSKTGLKYYHDHSVRQLNSQQACVMGFASVLPMIINVSSDFSYSQRNGNQTDLTPPQKPDAVLPPMIWI